MGVSLEAFPAPRLNRAAAGTVFSGVPVPPVPHIYPFSINTLTLTRTTVSTPRIVGPAILRSMKFYFEGATSPNAAQALEVGIATASVVEAGVVLATVKPWRSIMTKLDEATPNDDARLTGFHDNPSQAIAHHPDVTLDLAIPDASFFLVLSLINTSGLTQGVHGHVVLLESVDPGVFANFL